MLASGGSGHTDEQKKKYPDGSSAGAFGGNTVEGGPGAGPAGADKYIDPSGGSSSGDADDYQTTQQTGNEYGGAPPAAGEPGFDGVLQARRDSDGRPFAQERNKKYDPDPPENGAYEAQQMLDEMLVNIREHTETMRDATLQGKGDNVGNNPYYPYVIDTAKAKSLASEGLTTQRPEIVSMIEFKPLFTKNLGSESFDKTKLSSFSPNMLKSMKNIEVVIPTPASRIIEMQTAVRMVVTANVKQIIDTLSRSFFKLSESELGPNIQQLIEKINKSLISTKGKVFDNVEYDFVSDDLDIDNVISSIMRRNSTLGSEIEKYKNNPYVVGYLRYAVLSRFSEIFLKIVVEKIKVKDAHMVDFFEDIIMNSKHVNSKVKQALDTRNLNISDYGDGQFLRKIVRTDMPNTINVARILKAMHASAAGLKGSDVEVFNDSNNEELNLKLFGSSRAFMLNNLNQSYDFYLLFFDPTCELLPNTGPEEQDDSITKTVENLTVYARNELKNALYPAIYELKNISKMTNSQQHIKLIVDHLHPSSPGTSFLSEDFLGKELVTLTAEGLDFNLQSMLLYFDQSITPDVKIKGNTTDSQLSKLAYKTVDLNDQEKINLSIDPTLNESRPVYLLDANGMVHPNCEQEGLFAKEALYGLEDLDVTRLSEASRSITEAVEDIVDDVDTSYGIKGFDSDADIPEDYIRGYFDNLAEIFREINSPASAGNISKARMTEAIMYARSGENSEFSARMFLASLGRFSHNTGVVEQLAVNNVTYTRKHVTDPEYKTLRKIAAVSSALVSAAGATGAGAGVGMVVGAQAAGALIGGFLGSAAAGAVTTALVATGIGAIVVGVVAGVAFAVGAKRNKDEASDIIIPSAKDRLFGLFYKDIIPGTDLDYGSTSYLFPDALYDEYKKDERVEYDSGKIESFWNKNKDNKSLKTIGNDDLSDGSQPSRATDTVFLRNAGNFNKIFKDVYDTGESSNNSKLCTYPMRYDREFILNRESIKSKFNNTPGHDMITDGQSLGSTSCYRALVLHNLTAMIIKNSISFTLSLDKLDGNDNNKNNKERAIKVHYNRQGINGMIDGLAGSDKDDSFYSKPAYKTAYDFCKDLRDEMLSDIEDLDNRAVVCLGAIDKIAGYYNKQMTSFSGGTLNQNKPVKSVMNYLALSNESLASQFYSEQQFKLSTVLNKKIMKPSKDNYYLPSSKDVTKNQITSMFKYFEGINRSFLSDYTLSNVNSDKKFILHVGLPVSLIDNLRNNLTQELGIDALDLENKTKGRSLIKSRSVIQINIWRKNILLGPTTEGERPDVLVLTKKFDMSKFFIDNVQDEVVNDNHLSFAASNVKYENFVNAHNLYHVNSNLSIVPIKGTRISQAPGDENSDNELSVQEKKEVFRNHLDDHYLKLYCKLMLGIDVEEDIYQFTQNVDKTLNVGSDPSLGGFFEQAFLKPIDIALPTDPSNIGYRRERDRLRSEAERSVFFGPKKYLNRIIYPKLFDRVFSIILPKPNYMPIELSQYFCTVKLLDKSFSVSEPSSIASRGKKKLADIAKNFKDEHPNLKAGRRSALNLPTKR